MKSNMWSVWATLVIVCVSQPMICTRPAKSLPALRALINNASSSLISHRMKSFIVNVLLDETWSEAIAGECINQNSLNTSNATVQVNDTDWQLHYHNLTLLGYNSEQNYVLNSTVAQYLHTISDRYGAAIAQAFVADAQGVLVGASYLTPDYWQGEEPKWSDAFNSCYTGVHISPLQEDPDGGFTQFIGLPVISEQNVAVGAFSWALREASLPCTIDGPTLADMIAWIHGTSFDNRTQEFLVDVLLPYSVDDYLVAAVRKTNNLQLTREILLERDVVWKSGVNASPQNLSNPLFNATINSTVGDYLRNITDFYADDRWIGEVMLIDIQGQLVAASERVDTYFHGNDTGFVRAFNNCSGQVDYSTLTFDVEDTQWGWRVVLPMTDSENKVIGAISWFLGAPGEPSTFVSAFLDIRERVQNSTLLSDRAEAFIIDRLLPYMTDDVFVAAVKASNKVGEPLAQTLVNDQVWRAAQASGFRSPLEISILNAPESVHLRKELKKIGAGSVYDMYVTDFRGTTVAMDDSTEDYYQGDEPGHIGALNGGHGGIYVEPQAFNPRYGVATQLVSLPLLDEHNRVVGAIVFIIAESGLECVDHALLFHEMSTLIAGLPVPDVLKSWYLHNILPEVYTQDYENDAQAVWIESYSLTELAEREANWTTNITARNWVTLTQSAKTLKQLQAQHPALNNAWVRAIRGEVVGAIDPPSHYWAMNETQFVRGFASCNGSVYAPPMAFDYHDEPLLFTLNLPTLDVDNTVRGTITFVVEFPTAEYVETIEQFPPVALAFSLITTLAGIAFGIVFFQYRKTNLIRMSSPAFLCLSLIGAVSTSWGLYTMVIQPEHGESSVCYARTFLVPLAFALFFSPLFMKSYRVYRIFEATLGAAPPKKFKSAKFRNKFVFIRVGSFVAIQLAICVLGMILPDRPRFEEDVVVHSETLQRTFTRQCTQNNVFLGLSLVYNLGLLLFGAIISVLGRRYPTAFNESIYLMITINLLASFSLIILFGNTIEDLQSVAWLNTLGGHLMLWVGMGLVFGAKVYQIATGHADDKVTLVVAPAAERKDSSSSTPPTGNKDSKKGTTLELPSKPRGDGSTPSRTEPTDMSSVRASSPPTVIEKDLPSVTIPLGEPRAD